MNNNKIIISICAAAVVLVLGLTAVFSVVKANESFWDKVAVFTGESLANKVFTSFNEEIVDTFGAAGDIWSSPKIAQIAINPATTTLGSLYNGDTRDRIITSLYYVLKNTDTATGAAKTLTAGTSTDVYGVGNSTALSYELTTSTSLVYVVSTTPGSTGTINNRIWASGSYLNLKSSALVTSTMSGIFGIEYKLMD